MARYRFQTDDVAEADAILREQLGASITHVGDRGGLRLEQDTLGPMEVSRVAYEMDLTVVAEPYSATFLQHVRGGRVRHEFAKRDNRWATGDVGVAVSPSFPVTATCEELDVDFVVIPPETFAEVARTPSGAPPALTSDHPVSAEAAAQWARTLAFVQDLLEQSDLNELVAGAGRRLLAAVTLATFPNDALLDPTIEDRHDAHPNTLRLAIAFIEADPTADLTVSDIARAAAVTPRAVQLAFRRHLGTTPMAYLRRVRLDLARRELQQGDPASLTVTAVAGRWGFTSSRFARLYRDLYGEFPSQTLRPGPPDHASYSDYGPGPAGSPAQSDDLRAALETARGVGIAVGILMGRHKITADEAFARLARASQSRNIKLSTLASDLVLSGEEPQPAVTRE